MNLNEQLAQFYHDFDVYHQGEDIERSRSLFKILLDKGRIIYCLDPDNNLIGFVESWRLDYKQFGWVICHPEYPHIASWDLEHGNICYLANVVIHPDYRFSYVYQYLKTEFFRQNFACEFFVGQAYRKRHQPLKVFTRQEFYNKYAKDELKEGVMNRG